MFWPSKCVIDFVKVIEFKAFDIYNNCFRSVIYKEICYPVLQVALEFANYIGMCKVYLDFLDIQQWKEIKDWN